jgi:hypothetical protein
VCVEQVAALQTNTSWPFALSIKWHLDNFIKKPANYKFISVNSALYRGEKCISQRFTSASYITTFTD